MGRRAQRNGEALAVEHVGQQQVVHVTAVTGRVDDLRTVADPAQVLDVPQVGIDDSFFDLFVRLRDARIIP